MGKASPLDLGRVFGHLPGLYLVIDGTGRVRAATAAYLRAVGLRRKDAIDRPAARVFAAAFAGAPPAELKALAASVTRVLRDAEADAEADAQPGAPNLVRPTPRRGARGRRGGPPAWRVTHTPLPGPAGRRAAFVLHTIEPVERPPAPAAPHAALGWCPSLPAGGEDERLAALLAAAPIGIAISTDSSGAVVAGNPALLSQFEMAPGDNVSATAADPAAPGRKVRYLTAGHEVPPPDLPLQRAAREGRYVPPTELEVRLPSGRDWVAEVSGAPVHDHDGRVVAALGLVMDVTEHRRVVRELRETARRERERAAELQALFDAVPTPVFIAHDAECRHISGNPAAEDLLRIGRGGEASLSAPAQVRPRHFQVFKGGRALADTELPLQTAARGTTVREFDEVLAFDDGTRRDILAFATPLWDDDGRPRGAVGVLVDVTERRLTIEALQAREAQLRSFVQQAPVAVAMFDRRMNYLAASDRWVAEYGAGRASVVGLNHYDLFPDLPPHWVRAHRRALAGESVSNEEDLWVRSEGARVWIRWVANPWLDVTGAIGGIIIMAENVTARRLAEEGLRDREARLAAILDTVGDVILTVDRRGVIRSANPAAEPVFGYARADLVGRDIALIIPDTPGDPSPATARAYLRTAPATIIGGGREVVARRKGGARFPAELAVNAVKLEGDRIFVCVIHDLSQRRALEREILQVSESEQARIGHDLHDGICQELVAAALALHTIADRLGRQPRADAGRAIREVAALIRKVNAEARDLSHGLNPVRLRSGGLPVALENLAAFVDRHAGVRCVGRCDESIRVPDDAAVHLYRIAQEATNNALRHAKARTITISLSARHKPRGPTPAPTPPVAVTLRVQDDGVGLSRATAANPGLGMQTMHYRATVIGAALRVAPRAGGGTVVTCTLQLRGEAATAVVAGEARAKPGRRARNGSRPAPRPRRRRTAE